MSEIRSFKKDELTVRVFDTRENMGVVATVRRRLGADVNAACGQLRRASMTKNDEMKEETT